MGVLSSIGLSDSGRHYWLDDPVARWREDREIKSHAADPQTYFAGRDRQTWGKTVRDTFQDIWDWAFIRPEDRKAEAAAAPAVGPTIRPGPAPRPQFTPAPALGPDPLDALEAYQARLMDQDAVNRDYVVKSQQLRDMYQQTSDPAEEARLAFLLGNLEEQRKAAHVIIGNVYGGAQQFAAGQADQMRAGASAAGAEQAGRYTAAADATTADLAALQQQYSDTGVGAESAPMGGGATDWLGVMRQAGADQGNLAQALSTISADDAAWMAQSLGGEAGAQQGDLERTALMGRAQIINEHDKEVAARRAAERAAYLQAQERLLSRGWDREDKATDVALQIAGLKEERRARAEAEGQAVRERERDWDMAAESDAVLAGGMPDPAKDPIGNRQYWLAYLSKYPQSQTAAKQGLLGPEAAAIVVTMPSSKAL